MAISAVHYPFHYKRRGLIQLAARFGPQRGLLVLQLRGIGLGLRSGLVVDLAGQLRELFRRFRRGGFHRELPGILRVGRKLPGPLLGAGDRATMALASASACVMLLIASNDIGTPPLM